MYVDTVRRAGGRPGSRWPRCGGRQGRAWMRRGGSNTASPSPSSPHPSSSLPLLEPFFFLFSFFSNLLSLSLCSQFQFQFQISRSSAQSLFFLSPLLRQRSSVLGTLPGQACQELVWFDLSQAVLKISFGSRPSINLCGLQRRARFHPLSW